MATYPAPGINTPHRAGASGNSCVAVGAITGNGSGGTAVAASVLNMLKLPKGVRVHDVIITAEVDTASLTIKAGYADVDANASFTDDDAFVVAGTSLATAATKVRMNNPAFPAVELLKESYLTITTAAATILATTDITMVALYSYMGSH